MAPRRHLVALTILVAVAGAVVAGQSTPDRPTDLETSGCFTCHEAGGGSFGPPLRAMYIAAPPANLSLALGEPTAYRVEVINAWTAELSEIRGSLNLSDAPSLGFASDLPPSHQSDQADMPAAGTDGRRVRTALGVPAGATEVLVRISASGGLAPADLALHVWPAAADPNVDAPFTVDARGAGAGESLRIQGGAAIAGLGAGTWTIEASQALADIPGVFVPQTVDFRLDAWSNVTAARTAVTASSDVLDGQDKTTPQNTSLDWRVLAERAPGVSETLRLTVNATAYYDHPGTTSGGLDTWHYTLTLPIGVYENVETPEPGTVIDAGERPVAPEPEVAIPWDRIGEIIGYTSAFLLLLSMITGGVFGKTSRRSLNRVFKSAKRRVAFHNFASYLLTFFALAHTVLFILETGFPWTLGIIWGGIALLAMLALGVTGALQVPMIRRWNYATWRWWHLGLAISALVFTIVHLLLDGANFTEVAEAVGWQDPFQ